MISIHREDPAIPYYLKLLGESFTVLKSQSAFLLDDPNLYAPYWQRVANEDFEGHHLLYAHPSQTAAAILNPHDDPEEDPILTSQPSEGSSWALISPHAEPFRNEIIQTYHEQEEKYFKANGPYIALDFLGVSPRAQWNGQGTELLTRIIDMSNRQKKNLFLAAMSPQLSTWYAKKDLRAYVKKSGVMLIMVNYY